jgi:hypothetical protein
MRPVVISSESCRPIVAREIAESRAASHRDLMRELAVELPRLAIVDTFPSLCDSRFCYQQPPGYDVLYSDANHLNPEGGRHVVATSGLLRQLEEMLRRPSSASTFCEIPGTVLGRAIGFKCFSSAARS